MIVLQIYFDVAAEQVTAFQAHYTDAYTPALRKQQGYLGSRLLQLYPATIAAEIEASPTEYNLQMELLFDSEENRRRWAASDEHQVVWPQATSMVRSVAWRGYTVAASDERSA